MMRFSFARNGPEVSPLYDACAKGDEDVVCYRINEHPGELAKTDMIGRTPLFMAAIAGHKEIVREILSTDAGWATLNKSDATQTTPLLAALNYHQHDTALALVEAGANVFLKDNEGMSPLFEACSCGFIDIVTKLAMRGADPNQLRGTRSLLYAIAMQKDDNQLVLRTLVECGADAGLKWDRSWHAETGECTNELCEAVYRVTEATKKE
jgi:ankyrin repeat protein